MYSSCSNTPWMFLGSWGLHVPPELPKCSWTLWHWSTWSFPAENLGTPSFECSPSLEESRIYHLSSAEMIIQELIWGWIKSCLPLGGDGNGLSDVETTAESGEEFVSHVTHVTGRGPYTDRYPTSCSTMFNRRKKLQYVGNADLHLPTIFPTPFINNLSYIAQLLDIIYPHQDK